MAVRDDCKRDEAHCLTSIILQHTDIDPNIGSTSCPLFWSAKTGNENEKAIRAIVNHPRFNYESKYHFRRGTMYEIIK